MRRRGRDRTRRRRRLRKRRDNALSMEEGQGEGVKDKDKSVMGDPRPSMRPDGPTIADIDSMESEGPAPSPEVATIYTPTGQHAISTIWVNESPGMFDFEVLEETEARAVERHEGGDPSKGRQHPQQIDRDWDSLVGDRIRQFEKWETVEPDGSEERCGGDDIDNDADVEEAEGDEARRIEATAQRLIEEHLAPACVTSVMMRN